MKTSAAALSALVLALTSAVTGAAPPVSPTASPQPPAPNWYNVEVIVFRSMDPAAGTGETWPADQIGRAHV